MSCSLMPLWWGGFRDPLDAAQDRRRRRRCRHGPRLVGDCEGRGNRDGPPHRDDAAAWARVALGISPPRQTRLRLMLLRLACLRLIHLQLTCLWLMLHPAYGSLGEVDYGELLGGVTAHCAEGGKVGGVGRRCWIIWRYERAWAAASCSVRGRRAPAPFGDDGVPSFADS